MKGVGPSYLSCSCRPGCGCVFSGTHTPPIGQLDLWDSGAFPEFPWPADGLFSVANFIEENLELVPAAQTADSRPDRRGP